MPRLIASDPYQGYQFEVLFPNGEVVGGFSTITTPELVTEQVEYKTGLMKMKQKFPGIPTISDITLIRGVIKNNSELYAFVKKTLDNVDYRTDLTIIHKHKDGTKRLYKLYNAFGIRVKMATDFDGNSSEISLEEMDIAFEDFDVEEQA